MTYAYKRGGTVPKSIAFMITLKVSRVSNDMCQKGDFITIDGVEHLVKSISKVEVLGDTVKIIGKCQMKIGA